MAERIKQFDANQDGAITREEFTGPENIFRNLDRTGDGMISAEGSAQFLGEEPQTGGQTPGTPVGGIPADVKPLSEMSATDLYKGEEGGLYGGGRNDPPAAHWAAYLTETEKIVPLDAAGRPSESGIIGLISIGFSNTSLEFAAVKKAADADPDKSPRVVLVNGAMGMRAAVTWAYDGADALPEGERERLDREMDVLRMPKTNRGNSPVGGGKDTWPTLELRLKQAGVSPAQVQVVWLKHVEAGPAALGGFPDHAKALQADMADILVIAKKRFPNLRVAYLSSRTYAGWAGPNCGSPEPYAHESAFAVRWLVDSQVSGEPQLNFDPARGEVKAPIALWGPYLWARGDRPRQLDGLIWSAADVRSDDHMHPSDAGCGKIAALLLNFLKTDAGARRWFLSPAALAASSPPQDLKALLGATGDGAAAAVAPTREAPIDVERAKQLMRRSQAGETLSAEDEAYLQRVRQEIARRQAPQ